MRAEELAGWLAALGVEGPPVRVGEESEQAWCVRPAPGRDTGGADLVPGCDVPDRDDTDRDDTDIGEEAEWDVFWCEQGGRYEWVRFADEATACFALFGRLVWAHAVRVASSPGPRTAPSPGSPRRLP